MAPVSDAVVREQLDPAVRDKVLQLDLKAAAITDYGDMSGGFSSTGSTGLELFLDDAPMTISRYPNEGFITISEVSARRRLMCAVHAHQGRGFPHHRPARGALGEGKRPACSGLLVLGLGRRAAKSDVD
jgi:hypothetical protein